MKWVLLYAAIAVLLGIHHHPLIWWSILLSAIVMSPFFSWETARITPNQLREFQAWEARRAARRAAHWSTRHPLLAEAVGSLSLLGGGAALLFLYVTYGPH
jgi:hypothetical protein